MPTTGLLDWRTGNEKSPIPVKVSGKCNRLGNRLGRDTVTGALPLMGASALLPAHASRPCLPIH